MDKQDIMYMVAGIVIVLVLAFIVKPAITGEETSLNLWDEGNGEEEEFGEIVAETMETLPTAAPVLSTPVAAPTWSGTVESLSFVDPSIYDVEFVTPTQAVEPPYSPQPITNWTTYMILEGSASGTTDIFYIPFSKWRIKYSVAPMNPEFASFDLIVKDAMDPNKLVGEIIIQNYDFVEMPEYESITKEVTLESGDALQRVWDADLGAYVYPTYSDTSTIEELVEEINTEVSSSSSSSRGVVYGEGGILEFEDPNSDIGSIQIPQNVVPSSITVDDNLLIREGNREYYLIISTVVIDSYTITIEVPS